MSKLNLKQRVFIDVIKHVPYGSRKMVSSDRVALEYIKELEESEEAHQMLIEAFEKRNGRKFDEQNSLDTWMLGCELSNKAYSEVSEAKNWLVENGFLRRWDKRARFGFIIYYGLTDKGWSVADAYIKLAEATDGAK